MNISDECGQSPSDMNANISAWLETLLEIISAHSSTTEL
jgi:hypothetical protein